jgi:hypothetical protein
MRKKLCEDRDGERSLANTLFTGATSSLHGELESRLPNFAPEVEIDRQGGPDNVCFAPAGGEPSEKCGIYAGPFRIPRPYIPCSLLISAKRGGSIVACASRAPNPDSTIPIH